MRVSCLLIGLTLVCPAFGEPAAPKSQVSLFERYETPSLAYLEAIEAPTRNAIIARLKKIEECLDSKEPIEVQSNPDMGWTVNALHPDGDRLRKIPLFQVDKQGQAHATGGIPSEKLKSELSKLGKASGIYRWDINSHDTAVLERARLAIAINGSLPFPILGMSAIRSIKVTPESTRIEAKDSHGGRGIILIEKEQIKVYSGPLSFGRANLFTEVCNPERLAIERAHRRTDPPLPLDWHASEAGATEASDVGRAIPLEKTH
jgi:hypothetical protein